MLNSFEIEKELLKLELTRFKDKPRIKGFSSDNESILYVKTSGDPKVKPVNKQPLVLNPNVLNKKAQIAQISGVEVNWGTYIHNTNLKGYKKRQHTGETPIEYGFATDIESPTALKILLETIGVLATSNEPNPLDDINDALISLPTDTTTRKSIIDARVGQGQFRKELLNHWDSCAVTGASNTTMLKASHIKPWKDSDNKERLDHFNGLLLTANLDAAFDSGLISFNDLGDLLISEVFDDADDYGISTGMRLKAVQNEHKPYLQHHRDEVFKGTS